jgi:hypothetical protein
MNCVKIKCYKKTWNLYKILIKEDKVQCTIKMG